MLPVERKQEPVASGVPIPEECGLQDLSGLQVQDASGKSIIAQFTPLAWWQDGVSIKWVLVQFLADTGIKGSSKYELLYGIQAHKPEEQQNTCIASLHPEGSVRIDTGVWRCQVGGGRILDMIEIYRDGGWEPAASPSSAPSFQLKLAGGRVCVPGRPQQMEIERNGPLSAIIRLQGDYIVKDEIDKDLTDLTGKQVPSGLTYDIRLEAYHRRSELRITHRLLASLGHVDVEDLSFEVPFTEAREFGCAAGNENGAVSESESILPAEALGVYQLSEQETRMGKRQLAEQETRDGVRESATLPPAREEGVVWWMAARTPRVTVMTTVKHFTEKYPKSLEAASAWLRIGLLPGWNEDRDSFLPADQREDYYVLRQGESRTHEFLLSFDRAKVSADFLRKQAVSFHSPMHALAPWSWYADSGALGDLLPRTDQFAKYEQAVDESLAVYLQRRETMHLYGDRNFGDDQYTGPGSWNNGEYDYGHVGMLHFLRGAGVSWFDQVAMPYIHHMMDIDVCGAGPGLGKVHQHTEKHNSEAPKLGSHAWIRGLTEYYCFTGDGFARDTAVMIADRWSQDILSGEKLESTERGMTWPVISMLAMYHTFPRARYLEAAAKLVDQVLDMQDPVEGNFTGSMDRPTTKDRWGTFVIGSPVMESLIMYVQTTNDERARHAVVAIARRLARLNWLEDIGAWEYTHSMLSGQDRIHNAKTDKMVTPGVLYAYLFSGDEELLDKALQAFTYSEHIPSRNGKDLGQTYCFGIRIPALILKCKEHRMQISGRK
nr:hypothetical protein [Paenibacillus lemnae]